MRHRSVPALSSIYNQHLSSSHQRLPLSISPRFHLSTCCLRVPRCHHVSNFNSYHDSWFSPLCTNYEAVARGEEFYNVFCASHFRLLNVDVHLAVPKSLLPRPHPLQRSSSRGAYIPNVYNPQIRPCSQSYRRGQLEFDSPTARCFTNYRKAD